MFSCSRSLPEQSCCLLSLDFWKVSLRKICITARWLAMPSHSIASVLVLEENIYVLLLRWVTKNCGCYVLVYLNVYMQFLYKILFILHPKQSHLMGYFSKCCSHFKSSCKRLWKDSNKISLEQAKENSINSESLLIDFISSLEERDLWVAPDFSFMFKDSHNYER